MLIQADQHSLGLKVAQLVFAEQLASLGPTEIVPAKQEFSPAW